MWTTPASRAASYISRTSPAFSASGFSHITCLPALAAARLCSWCVKFGVAMMTASTSSDSTIAAASVETRSIPHSAFRRSRRAGSASQAATSSARGSSRMPGTWW